ncbi:MAG: type I restriction endonuclease subunit R, partial [Mycoplasmataceae bacterium]|nr:type I restriction endonuclease subunit R [Mycoplasmataceae bacterium]
GYIDENGKYHKGLKDIVNERIKNNCQYILEKYNTLTKANHTSNNSNKVQKFNAILACKDIDLAKLYYIKLKELINANLYQNSTLKKVGIIYSYVQNPDEEDNSKDFDTNNLEPNDKYFLDSAIKDYNQLFNANFSINTFNNYYRDVSKRLKEQELDLLIVVNMFLTGFDSPSLNTIFIDKKLRFHELIQTYSRTNRILDSIKDCGNVVNFQEFRKEQNEAYKLYSNESDIVSLIELRDKKSYIDGYIDENGKYHKGLKDIVNEINEKFPNPSQIREEDIDKQKEFINLQTNYLRLVNKLSSFVDLKEEELNKLLLNHENEYKGVYNNLKAEFKNKYEQTGDSSIFNNVEFEKQLIEITDTIDEKYIFNLIKDCIVSNKTNNASFNKLTKEQIKDIILKISASPEVENKKEAYEEFLNKIDLNEIDASNIFDLLFNKLSKFKPEFATKKLNELEKKYILNHDEVIKLFKYWTKNNNYEFNGKKVLEISLDLKTLLNNVKNNPNFYDEYKRKIRQELINFYST